MKPDLEISAVNPTRKERKRRSPWLKFLSWTAIALTVLALCLFWWGGPWLVATDHLPGHNDAAIVLQGSVVAHRTRLEGGVALLRAGLADRILLSIPQQGEWGEAVAPVAREYVEQKYGKALAARIDMCETGPEVNSTSEEAQVLLACIKEHQWHSIAVVSSDYHTRRAGILWRRLVKSQMQPPNISIYGVEDPECELPDWWHNRLSAKIWFMESTKLLWVLLGGN